MAKVLGVGGIFFKARDSQELGAWYARWLNMPVDGGVASFKPAEMPPDSFVVWSPFEKGTSYFNPSTKEFMFNLIVDDLTEALAQARQGGAQIVEGIEEYDYGRFGWFIDPEGNKVELWQPAGQPGTS